MTSAAHGLGREMDEKQFTCNIIHLPVSFIICTRPYYYICEDNAWIGKDLALQSLTIHSRRGFTIEIDFFSSVGFPSISQG